MSQQWKAPEGEEDVQMPLHTGGGEEPAMEENSSGPKLKVNTSTVALVAAFAAALVVLYFLGLQNKPRAASADETAQALSTDQHIKSWLERRGGTAGVEGPTESDRIFVILKQYFDNKNTGGIADLVDNPFAVEEKVTKVDPMTNIQTTVVKPTLEPVDPQLVEAAKVYGGLKLQMVIIGQGQPSTALINNQMASVGSKFGPLVVTDILEDQVILSYKDKTYALKRNGPQLGGGK